MTGRIGRVIAVVGGDERERHLAERLAADGHQVRVFGGVTQRFGGRGPVVESGAAGAVRTAEWLICPTPGISDAGALYAPFHDEPILVDELLGAATDLAGGVVLGRATPAVRETAGRLGIRLHEVAGEESVRLRLAEATAEGVVSILIERTDRVLPECPVLLLGTGRVAAAIVRLLRGWRVPTVVAGRDDDALRRLTENDGVTAVPYADREYAVAGARIVVNTVPSPDALPVRILRHCRGRLVVDVASPPGGLDHTRTDLDDVEIVWARGMAGRRAPVSAGDALFDLVAGLVAEQEESTPS